MRRFLHRLALALGEADVDALAARLGTRRILEWMRYERLEPWGEQRADLRSAIIAATLANVHRDPRRRPQPFTPADFMPRFGEPPRPKRQSLDEMRAVLMAAAAAAQGAQSKRS